MFSLLLCNPFQSINKVIPVSILTLCLTVTIKTCVCGVFPPMLLLLKSFLPRSFKGLCRFFDFAVVVVCQGKRLREVEGSSPLLPHPRSLVG